MRMLADVIKQIETANTTLVFTNTRSQSELWFRALLQARPDWIGLLGLHHGSIDRKIRHAVEDLLRKNKMKAAVCTASLDLGVDFWPVDQVIQIGSPKSVARAMQRAGRSGHQPGANSRLVCVPTQAIELIEFSAARHAIEVRNLESRDPIRLALDVLAQHIVTIAAGDGFVADQLLQEVRTTHAYADLTDQQWQWGAGFCPPGWRFAQRVSALRTHPGNIAWALGDCVRCAGSVASHEHRYHRQRRLGHHSVHQRAKARLSGRIVRLENESG